VRKTSGEWNFDPLFRNAAMGSGGGTGRAPEPPYLEATHARINIKNGVEKLPFSLLDADASVWQESSGEWRVRLRGQPARTDVSLDLGDTGIVRVEARLRPAAQLNQMPLHLDLDWREAQLGQLSRLMLSSDEGWRGDMTGELHLDGTAESAKVQTRLRATGVHRAEFAPAAPIDFDANCGFTFHYPQRRVEGLICNSPIGDGRARLTGEAPGGSEPPRLTLELDRIPAQAALDLLRTMRSTIDPSLEAAGTVSGRRSYDEARVVAEPAAVPVRRASGRQARAAQAHAVAGPMTGALTVTGLRISGDALSRPIQAANMTLEPAPAQPGQPPALAMSMTIPAGGTTPLNLTARLGLNGFELGVRGTAAIARLREFAHVAGSPAEAALAQLAGEPATLEFTAEGPWLPPADVGLAAVGAGGTGPLATPAPSIRTSGTATLRNANWKASFLANPVLIALATLHLGDGTMAAPDSAAALAKGKPAAAPRTSDAVPVLRWDPVEFSYGPVKGIATVEVPVACAGTVECPRRFTAKFATLDASAVQAALLGAHEPGTLLSTVLARLKPNAAPSWPPLEGTAEIGTLLMGPFKLTHVQAAVKVLPAGADVPAFDATLLGGAAHGSASLVLGDKPAYKLDATLTRANPAQVGALAGMTWSGGELNGSGKVELSGYTDEDLGASAKGTIHFDWQRGSAGGGTGSAVPPALARFDRWSGDVTIAGGGMAIAENQVKRGAKKSRVEAAVTFGSPAEVRFGAAAKPLPASSAKR